MRGRKETVPGGLPTRLAWLTARFSRSRFVDREGATVEVFAMQRLDCGVSAFFGFHGDESETARPAAEPIHYHIHLQDGAVLGEHVLELVFGGVERKISYKQFSAHDD